MAIYRDQFSRFAHLYDRIIKNPIVDIFDFLDPKCDDIILDVGGGTGQIASVLEKNVKSVIIVDPSPVMLQKAKEKSHQVKTVYGIGEAIPFSDNYFDKILLYDALHHTQNPEKVLEECIRVVKPNGRLIIGEIFPHGVYGRLLLLMERIMRIKGIYYTPNELKQSLNRRNYFLFRYLKMHSLSYICDFRNGIDKK